MKVLVVLGLLAITAVFAAHHHHAKLIKTTVTKKKLIGGPDSLPFFLRKNKTEEVAPAAEQSAFADDAKATVTKVKTTVVENAKKLHGHFLKHAKNVHEWVKSKVTKKVEAAPAPVPEQSGFVEDAKVKATTIKTKVVEGAKKLHAHIKNHGKKALNWIKSKFSKKNETAEVAPVAEQSAFVDDAKTTAVKVKKTVVEHAHKIHNHIKHHGKKALDWIKSKFSKKNETAEVAPVAEQSAFVDDAKTTAVKVKKTIVEHATNLHNHIKNHGKKAVEWIKTKVTKKTEAAPAPVAEQSAFVDDAKTKITKVKKTVVEGAKKLHAHVKTHGKKALDWIKSKFSKKNETVEAAPAPVEQSAFVDDAKTTAVKVKKTVVEHATNLHNHIKNHGKKAVEWIKSKVTKKTEAAPAPVAEQSAFVDDVQATATKVKESTKTFFNKLHGKAQEGIKIVKKKIQEKF